MNTLNKFICFFTEHLWDFNTTGKQRKCDRCKTFEVKNYYGKWLKADPRVKQLYPTKNHLS